MTAISTKVQLPDIVASTYINAPVERTYASLTTAEGWNSWFTSETTLDLRPGGKIRLVWKNWGVENMDVEDGGAILEVRPNDRFSFHWQTDISQTKVTFTLQRRGEGTLLTVTDAGWKADEVNRFLGCAVGWGEAITLLKFYLEHGVIYGKVPN
jgi:uncharacterized protein YndB with AHSA1/START domain